MYILMTHNIKNCIAGIAMVAVLAVGGVSVASASEVTGTLTSGAMQGSGGTGSTVSGTIGGTAGGGSTITGTVTGGSSGGGGSSSSGGGGGVAWPHDRPGAGCRMRIFILDYPGHPFAIEASDDLVSWERLGTVPAASGSSSFTDENAGTHSRRFYRAVESEQPARAAKPVEADDESL